jgi:hypothetical protein
MLHSSGYGASHPLTGGCAMRGQFFRLLAASWRTFFATSAGAADFKLSDPL